MDVQVMEKVVSLCKRRGFIFPGSEIYGGLANSWDYGPLGVELKNNIKNLWWKRFVHCRDDIVGIDASLIMNPSVWEASGHVATFTDPLIECKVCHERMRADQQDAADDHEKTHHGKTEWTDAKQFNLLFKTYIGPAEETENLAYLRPETAQAMFVNFKNVLETSRKSIPFGIAQIGRAFRNEITPGNYIFRTREFEQMEIEYFIPRPKTDRDWQHYFEEWRKIMHEWMENDLGLDKSNVHELEVPESQRAHYSKRTIDFEFDFPFGRKELYGLAYRMDFDLKSHAKMSGQDLAYRDPQTNEKYIPHVVEPTWGVDRSVLAVLVNGYHVDTKRSRILLRIKPSLSPIKAAVFPLLANRPELVRKARAVYSDLRKNYMISWDDRGNIGKRYLSQDEIGTPFCITIDFQTLEDNTVTIRDRDSGEQVRTSIDKLDIYIQSAIA